MRWLDRTVALGVAALVVVAPLPMGSAHSWAFKPIEAVIFALSAAWMAKLWNGNATLPRIPGFKAVVAAGGGFALLILLQLCPLPPKLLRVASPSTYALYVETLPGWPGKPPYTGFVLTATQPASGTAFADRPAFLPRADDARGGGAPTPFAKKTNAANAASPPHAGRGVNVMTRPFARSAAPELHGRIWRTLSVAPTLTYPAVLKALAYSALFLVVLCYPYGDGDDKAERQFRNTLLTAILLTGALAALIGLAEKVEWNGRVLWLFVPSDWGAPAGSTLSRAIGPFVNPDHFATYLAMALPLALAAGLFPTTLAPRREPGPLRIASLGVALLIFSALILSLSRGGWIGAAAGLMTLFALSFWASGYDCAPQSPEIRNADSPKPRSPASAHRALPVLCVLGFGVLVLLSLALIGPEGRDETGARLRQTVSGGGNLLFRVALWRDSLRMARDFPIFGVGLGAWPELFPRYRGGPWSYLFMPAAHNDYVQLLAETGLIGSFAAAAFFAAAGRRIIGGFARLDRLDSYILAAIIGGLAAAAAHELFDFSLQIPANAILFTVLFALALRIASKRPSAAPVPWNRTSSACCFVAFLGLAGVALTQTATAYQYDAPPAKSVAQARAFVLAHPANSSGHLALALMLSDPGEQGGELKRAIWLAPTDPHPRDIYAQYLTRAGYRRAAARQITLSVFNSPDWSTHFYLNPVVIPWLSPSERRAIESGFKRAIAADYGGAVGGLGRFYGTLGRFSGEAELYTSAALRERSLYRRAVYLTDAGEAYVRAGDRRKAERDFIDAEHSDPAGPRAYEDLLNLVCGPEADMALARATVESGIANGVDPGELYSSLAAAAERAGDRALARDAMAKLVRYAPTFHNTMRLGLWYLQAGQPERATETLERAVRLNPHSPEAYYFLALARERNYDYPAADRAYARAVKLAPQNLQFRRDYDAFRKRIGYAGVSR